MERDYYPLVEHFAIKIARITHSGIDIRSAREVKVWLDCNREFDVVVAFRTPKKELTRLLSIEVKRDGDAKGLLHQALIRTQFFDYCYIAVPTNFYLPSYFDAYLRWKIHLETRGNPYNVGFLIIDYPNSKITLLRHANKNSHLRSDYKSKIFNRVFKQSPSEYIEKMKVIESEQITFGDEEIAKKENKTSS